MKIVKTPFLQNTTGLLLPIIAVSIVVKGELAIQIMIQKLKHTYQFEPEVEVIKKEQSW